MRANQIATPPTSQVEPDFVAAMSPKKSGRPRKIAPAPAPPPGPGPLTNNISISNINNIDIPLLDEIDKDIKELKGISIKDKLTAQELRFLEIYFNSPRVKGQDRKTIDKAMILSGYGDFSERMRYLIARKTFQKYAKAAPDAAKIFQDLGFGPVRVALGIIDHCENAPPTVSLNALKLAAQCQGMVEKVDNPNAGINIYINTGPSPGPAAPGTPPPVVGVFGAPDEAQAQAQAQPPPRRPLQITR